MRLTILLVVLVGCGDCNDVEPVHVPPDSRPGDAFGCPRTSPCNPLTQAGCCVGQKCTWRLDAVMPQYIGHVSCAPDGSAAVDEPCMYGPPGVLGYDNCKKGLVCGDYRGGTGVCKQICDQQGGAPMCDAQHACVTYPGLFNTGDTTPSAGGVCDVACDPLTENDFDGSGSATKSSSTCGSAAEVGCYGYPSLGSPPRTSWTCMPERNLTVGQPTGLRHRVQCTTANGCADPGPTLYVNSCNQGYLPLLRESATISTAICVALCKPLNCYAGNCGPANQNRLGEAPHRCTSPDRVGTFDTSVGGEHCRFIWSFEIDDQGNFLRSPSSDTLGFCFDHSKYLYDSDADNVPDTPYPACSTLADGFGSGVFGAADLGCVDTTHAQLMNVPPRRFDDVRPLSNRFMTTR
ncbi:MAG TPA: hypothetical protein VIV11_26710 [Kofleriaceae bacterium]